MKCSLALKRLNPLCHLFKQVNPFMHVERYLNILNKILLCEKIIELFFQSNFVKYFTEALSPRKENLIVREHVGHIFSTDFNPTGIFFFKVNNG